MPGFPRRVRLRRPAQFQSVLSAGRRVHAPPLTAVLRHNAESGARLGLAISARAVPGAVARNRLKRLIRESFRAHQARLPAVDIVILARTGAGAANTAHLRGALQRLWDQTCGTS